MISRFQLDRLPEVSRMYSVTRRTVWQIADNYHILLLVKEGCCTIELDGETMRLEPGDLCLIPEGSPYIRRPGNHMLCTMFYAHFHLPMSELTEEEARAALLSQKETFDLALLHNESLSTFPKQAFLSRKISLPEHLDKLIALFQEGENAYRENTLLAPMQMSILLCHLLMEASEKTCVRLLRGERLGTSGETPEKLRRAVLFIRQHYSEKISLEDLCRFCAVSPQQMIRYFRANLNTTPTAYIIQYKMDKARELLMYAPQMSIKEVAAELGFDDQCYFSRAFSRCTGESPTEYRNRAQHFDSVAHVDRILHQTST